jgi:hypothetical protein
MSHIEPDILENVLTQTLYSMQSLPQSQSQNKKQKLEQEIPLLRGLLQSESKPVEFKIC